MKKILLLGALTAGLAGCSTSQSADIATDGIHADLSVTADGSGQSTAVAVLRAGDATSNDFIDLSAGDTLVATEGSNNAQTMVREDFANLIYYQAIFAVDSADTPFDIAFNRTNYVSAPNSAVTLPAPFVLTGPTENAGISRQSPITITWSGSGQADPMHWDANGDCIQAVGADISSDTGTATIAAGTIVPQQGQGTASCTVTIHLSRTRAGTLDPAYGKGGEINAVQERSVDILSQP